MTKSEMELNPKKLETQGKDARTMQENMQRAVEGEEK